MRGKKGGRKEKRGKKGGKKEKRGKKGERKGERKERGRKENLENDMKIRLASIYYRSKRPFGVTVGPRSASQEPK